MALADREVLTAADLRLDAATCAAAAPRSPAAMRPCSIRSGGTASTCRRPPARSAGTGARSPSGSRGWASARWSRPAGDRGKAALALAGDPALARTVEVKLGEYHEHLLRSVAGFDSADAALAACRRRFKNLPERHFRSLEALVRETFSR